MEISQHKIKEATLTNNCPECFCNEGLVLTFYQKQIKNAWYHNTTKEISDKIECGNCNTIIYPVRWTEDIERVREFYFKTIEQPKSRLKLTSLSIFTLIGIVIVAIAIFIAIQENYI